MSSFKIGKCIVMLSVAAALAACGGGGGDETGGDDTGGGGGGTPTNLAPVANAGADQSLTSGVLATLSASGSTDADGTISSYAWTQTAGPTVTLAGATTSTATFTTPSVTTATTFTFRVTVTDNKGATSTDTMTLTISASSGGGGGSGSCPTPPAVTPVTQTQPVKTLYSFSVTNFNSVDGREPEDALVEAPDGNFYGVTRSGGFEPGSVSDADGVVFRVSRDGAYTRMYSFYYRGAALHGTEPVGGLIMGADCNLYGTTRYGGPNGSGSGTIFRMTLSGEITYVASFNNTNGRFPLEQLVQSADGNFYGTTFEGGAAYNQVSNYLTGTVFKMTTGGALTTLVSFNGPNGGSPVGKLTQGSDGNFYGVTSKGGANGEGTIYKVSPTGQFTLLWSFVAGRGTTSGIVPYSGLVEANDGYLYGTAAAGGSNNEGVIYKISKSGQYSIVHSFYSPSVALGCNCGISQPYAGLILGKDGNLYTSTRGGLSAQNSGEAGAVIRVSPQGLMTPVAYFPAGGPREMLTELVQSRDGHLYGASFRGGANGEGAFFRVLLPGG